MPARRTQPRELLPTLEVRPRTPLLLNRRPAPCSEWNTRQIQYESPQPDLPKVIKRYGQRTDGCCTVTAVPE